MKEVLVGVAVSLGLISILLYAAPSSGMPAAPAAPPPSLILCACHAKGKADAPPTKATFGQNLVCCNQLNAKLKERDVLVNGTAKGKELSRVCIFKNVASTPASAVKDYQKCCTGVAGLDGTCQAGSGPAPAVAAPVAKKG